MEDYNNPKREQEATIQIGNVNATALKRKNNMYNNYRLEGCVRNLLNGHISRSKCNVSEIPSSD